MFVKIYKYFFELKVLKGADIVRTYSKTNQSFIEKYGYRGEFFELLEGINEKELPLILNEIHFEKDINKILYIGRIDFYNKGMDQLLLAFEKVKINNLKFKLDIYGPFATSNDQRILLKHLNNFNTDIVEYHGPIYGTKKFEILKNSDLLVLPSRFEGIPRVIRESLFYGTPVLVTKETNFAEYITKYKCGFVCRCEGNDIFDALIDFGNYQDKNELRINSEYLISEFYNWEKVRERLSLLIKRYIPDNYKNELNEIE
jgi:glycosyltransferase involved in cell wall biosynthesis